MTRHISHNPLDDAAYMPNKTHADVAQKILAEIESGGFKPGDRHINQTDNPTEDDFAR